MWAWLKHKPTIYTPKRDDEHPCHVYMGVPPRGENSETMNVSFCADILPMLSCLDVLLLLIIVFL